jgi:NTE family protein
LVGTTAIVVAGAGARGAYEAGALSELVPRLVAEAGAGERILVIGTSAGAINAALLAAVPEPQAAVDNAVRLWRSVGFPDVVSRVAKTALRDLRSYAFEVVTHRRNLQSLLDSTPLRGTLATGIDWDVLRSHLDRGRGWVRGMGVVTTSCDTGRTVVFLQGRAVRAPASDDARGIDYLGTNLGVDHVLASAAIPIAFRPVSIEGLGWHVDGGVRLNAPIRPAIDLGADRVVVVATTPDPEQPQPAPVSAGRPDVFDAAGVVLNAVLDARMAEDVRSLRRTNALLRAGATRRIPGRRRPYRVVEHLFLGPPNATVIPETADRIFRKRYGSLMRRPLSDLHTLGRLIGGSTASHAELLSFLFFDPGFHTALSELGAEHARQTLGDGPRLPWR